MAIEKIELISRIPQSAAKAELGNEVEQHFTLTHRGEVTLDAYSSDDGTKACRHFKVHMDQQSATMTMVYIDLIFTGTPVLSQTPDIGNWQLTIYSDDGEPRQFTGAMDSEVVFDGRSISFGIRKFVPITNLLLFDGKW
jgi:hypothetical protein